MPPQSARSARPRARGGDLGPLGRARTRRHDLPFGGRTARRRPRRGGRAGPDGTRAPRCATPRRRGRNRGPAGRPCRRPLASEGSDTAPAYRCTLSLLAAVTLRRRGTDSLGITRVGSAQSAASSRPTTAHSPTPPYRPLTSHATAEPLALLTHRERVLQQGLEGIHLSGSSVGAVAAWTRAPSPCSPSRVGGSSP